MLPWSLVASCIYNHILNGLSSMGYEQEMALYFSLRCFQMCPAGSPSPSLDGIAGMYQSFPINFRQNKFYSQTLRRPGPAHVQPPSTSSSKPLPPCSTGLTMLVRGDLQWPGDGLAVQFLFLHVCCDGLNCVSWKKICWSSNALPPSVALFENQVFTEVIQLMWGH